MLIGARRYPAARTIRHAAVVALACAGAMACQSGGSPSGPTGPGGGGAGGGGGTNANTCRTVAATGRSRQVFADGKTVSADTTCTVSGTDVICNSNITDSFGGTGTASQTTRFASRNDIVDEAATNPPLSLSLGTTTVISIGGLSTTTTSTNTYDAQRRLLSIAIANPSPLGTTTTTFTAWDGSGRPTAGSVSGDFIIQSVSITYDDANRSLTRIQGQNTCTVTHDQNGIMTREVCTGTTPSTTDLTVLTTASICK